MTDFIRQIFMLALSVFEGFCMNRLFQAFVSPRWSGLRWSTGIIGAVWVLYHGICLWQNWAFYPSSVWNLAVYLCVLFGTALLWYRGGILLKLFLVVQFAAIHELSIWAANSLIAVHMQVLEMLGNGVQHQVLSLSAFMSFVTISNVALFLAVGALREGMTYCFIRRIVKACRFPRRFEKNILPYLLPAAASVLVAFFIRLLMLAVENSVTVTLYARYPQVSFLIPLLAVILLLANSFSFEMFQNMAAFEQQRTEKLVLENQVSSLKNSIAEMESVYDSVRSVKHDMKNHMLILRTLLDEPGSGCEAKAYLEQLYPLVEQMDTHIRTGNAVADVVVNAKFQYAKKTIPDIRFDAEDFVVPDTIAVKAYDIGIILSNGLDNAVEACQNLRRKEPDAEAEIVLRSFWKGNMYFLEIENSFDGVFVMEADGEYPRSTKPDPDEHGIGLKNIRSCAQKYAGDMDCIVKGRHFILSVMLKGT